MDGLAKSFRGPGGPVRAVAAWTCASPPARRRAARAERRRQDHDDRHDARPAPPTPASVTVFGTTPADGGRGRARSARCCRPAALLGDLTVREMVAMMASLYPRAAARRRGARAGRHRPTSPSGAPDSCPAARRSGCASRWRWSRDPDLLVLDEPTVAMDVEARRSFWATMRALHRRRHAPCCSPPTTSRRPTQYADRIVLMAARPGRRRRPGDPDQGARRRADDPRHAAGRRARRAGRAPRRRARSTPRRRRRC